MIFTPLADFKTPFQNSTLVAVNLFTYISSTSKEDCDAGIGCTIQEFEVHPELLNLAMLLNYEHESNIDLECLNTLKEKIINELNESINEGIEDFEIIVGIKLFYLVMAKLSAFYYETLPNTHLEILSQLELAMNSYAQYFELQRD